MWNKARLECSLVALLLTGFLFGCADTTALVSDSNLQENKAVGQTQNVRQDSDPSARLRENFSGVQPDLADGTIYADSDPASQEEIDGALFAAPGLTTNQKELVDTVARFHGLAKLRDSIADRTVRLVVPVIPQNPELPNGCEITSAAIVLNYLGVSADKLTLADHYLPKNEEYQQTDPEKAYMGSPREGEIGYYCMTDPVVKAVNQYLADTGQTHLKAQDVSGDSLADLKRYLLKGIPVLVWVTQDFEEPRYVESFTLPDGSMPYLNLHCLVLTGYDDNRLYLTDPLAHTASVTRGKFANIYREMGSRAVIIRPNEAE